MKVTPEAIEAYAEKINAKYQQQKAAWVEEKVIPYLIFLLDTAQSRLRSKLRFVEGMGSYSFCLGQRDANPYTISAQRHIRDLQYAFTQATDGTFFDPHCCSKIVLRIHVRFPELVTLCDLVDTVITELDLSVGILEPSVKPREKPRLTNVE